MAAIVLVASITSSSFIFTSRRLRTPLPLTLLRPNLTTSLSTTRTLVMASSLNLGLTQPASIQPLKICFGVKDVDALEWKGDLLAVGVAEKDMSKDDKMKFNNPILNKLDSKLGGLLSEASTEEDFSGKPGQSTILRLPGLSSKRIGLFGLGSPSPSLSAFRSLGEALAAASKTAHASNVAVLLASSPPSSPHNTVSAIASGTMLGMHDDSRFKSDSKKPSLKSLDIIGFGTAPELGKRLKYVEDICSGVIFGRELVNAPANVLTPGQ